MASSSGEKQSLSGAGKTTSKPGQAKGSAVKKHFTVLQDRYLRAPDLVDGPVTWKVAQLTRDKVPNDRGDAKLMGVLVFENGAKFGLGARVNERTMVKLFGQDPLEWVGQYVTLYPTTTKFGGKMVPCIRIKEEGAE